MPVVPVRLYCTDEALAVFTEFANCHERRLAADGDLAHAGSWAGKHVGHVLRIAGMLALWQDALHEPLELTSHPCRGDIESAITIGAYLVPHATRALSVLGRPDWIATAERILGWLRRTGSSAWSVRDCFRALTGSRSRVTEVSDLDRPLAALVERGYIRRVERPTTGPGRPPSPQYQTNPEVLHAN
jgi:hypothetical protein